MPVINTQQWPNSLRRLHSVVMRHCREQMMRHMCISDVMKHAIEKAIVAVDRSQCTAKPIPLFRVVVRKGGVSMLQVSDDHKPCIHD
ncbi:hypothetical protein IEQ34_011805 [Dendrobium chrysotoxum]|uniref:Uncharacterized protein n=1 Tax=Dendrobium chrysotoxum TaxID=161865 RepID=A0AAV7GSK7_DENCH|nr:hypothetical protein IEQ34_011805 [Dendrobium chrysotoxum]